MLHHRGQNIGGNETKTIRDGELGGAKQMTQKEMIDDVVRVYFEGGDWQGYLKELVREVKNGEIQNKRDLYMRRDTDTM